MQAIYLNQEQVSNILRKVTKRETRFQKRYGDRNKYLSHAILQRRRAEYFSQPAGRSGSTEEEIGYVEQPIEPKKTPALMLEELRKKFDKGGMAMADCARMTAEAQHELNMNKLSLAKRKQEQSEIKADNVIAAYENTHMKLTGDQLVTTIGQLMAQDAQDNQNPPEEKAGGLGDKTIGLGTRIGHHFGQVTLEKSELEQIREMQARQAKINTLLTGDIKEEWSPQDFRKMLDRNNPDGWVVDIAYSLLSKGIDVHNGKCGDQPDPSFKSLCPANSPSPTKNGTRSPALSPDSSKKKGSIDKLERSKTRRLDQKKSFSMEELEPAKVWQLPIRPRFGEYLPKSRNKDKRLRLEMSDFTGQAMFDILVFALSHSDRDLFLEFRAGIITLSQLIYRANEKLTGHKITVLDDVRDCFTNQGRTKPDPDLVKAYDANLQEEALYAGARRRGIPIEMIKKSAKHYTMNLRCAKACFGAPRKRQEIAGRALEEARAHTVSWDKRAANAKKLREQTLGERDDKIRQEWELKEAQVIDNLDNLKLKGKRALMQSRFDQECKQQIFGKSDYNLGSKFKDRIYKLFKEEGERQLAELQAEIKTKWDKEEPWRRAAEEKAEKKAALQLAEEEEEKAKRISGHATRQAAYQQIDMAAHMVAIDKPKARIRQSRTRKAKKSKQQQQTSSSIDSKQRKASLPRNLQVKEDKAVCIVDDNKKRESVPGTDLQTCEETLSKAWEKTEGGATGLQSVVMGLESAGGHDSRNKEVDSDALATVEVSVAPFITKTQQHSRSATKVALEKEYKTQQSEAVSIPTAHELTEHKQDEDYQSIVIKELNMDSQQMQQELDEPSEGTAELVCQSPDRDTADGPDRLQSNESIPTLAPIGQSAGEPLVQIGNKKGLDMTAKTQFEIRKSALMQPRGREGNYTIQTPLEKSYDADNLPPTLQKAKEKQRTKQLAFINSTLRLNRSAGGSRRLAIIQRGSDVTKRLRGGGFSSQVRVGSALNRTGGVQGNTNPRYTERSSGGAESTFQSTRELEDTLKIPTSVLEFYNDRINKRLSEVIRPQSGIDFRYQGARQDTYGLQANDFIRTLCEESGPDKHAGIYKQMSSTRSIKVRSTLRMNTKAPDYSSRQTASGPSYYQNRDMNVVTSSLMSQPQPQPQVIPENATDYLNSTYSGARYSQPQQPEADNLHGQSLNESSTIYEARDDMSPLNTLNSAGKVRDKTTSVGRNYSQHFPSGDTKNLVDRRSRITPLNQSTYFAESRNDLAAGSSIGADSNRLAFVKVLGQKVYQEKNEPPRTSTGEPINVLTGTRMNTTLNFAHNY